MSQTVSLREANQRFARILRAVEQGREFVVTRRGRPIARIIPAMRGDAGLTPEQQRALEHLKSIAAKGYRTDDTPFDRAALHER
jgi:prevent-host-death family protein